MPRNPSEILEEALALPPEARAALAGSLPESLETEVDPEAEAAWQSEVHTRLRELDERTTATIPWSEVRARLMRCLER
jgi:putative addiction module component (TIGR02574 family)